MRDEFLISGKPDIGPEEIRYRAVHLHPYYRDKYDLDPAAFPVATDISNRTLSLPLGTNVTHADQDDVVEALRTHLVTRIGVGA